MDPLKDAYNRAYIFVHTLFNRELAANEKILDAKAQDILKDWEMVKNKVSDGDLSKIKVKIIKKFYEINNDNKTHEQGIKKSPETFLMLSARDVRKHLVSENFLRDIKTSAEELAGKMNGRESIEVIQKEISNAYRSLKGISHERRLQHAVLIAENKMNPDKKFTFAEMERIEVLESVHKMSIDSFKKSEDPKLAAVKEKYIKELTDPKIKELLKNDKVLALAKEIDNDMKKELNLREFAELIGVHYPNSIKEILTNENETSGKTKVVGADEFADAYLAVFLLQKNNVFKNAILSLDDKCAQLGGEVGALEAALSAPYLASQVIN